MTPEERAQALALKPPTLGEHRSTTTGQPKLTGKALPKVEAAEGGSFIEGYAAVWDNVDLGHERMKRGAFAKSIQERVPTGRVKLMGTHFAWGGDMKQCVGTVTDAREDDYGLWFHAEMVPNDQEAAEAHNKVVTGHVGYCSVGYGPVRWQIVEEEEGEVLEHLECKLYEVTLTVQPMNEQALITAAKAMGLVTNDELDTMAQVLAISSGAPSEEGRAKLKALGTAKVAKVGKCLAELSAKVQALTDSSPNDTAKAQAKAADIQQLKSATARCRGQLAILALEMED